jgi:hypothetical protein
MLVAGHGAQDPRLQSAKADFAFSQPRIHSPRLGTDGILPDDHTGDIMRPSIRHILLTIVAILASAPAAAQEEDTVPAAPHRGGIEMIGGARVGWPQKVSGYVGIAIPTKRYEAGGYTGWSIIAEPGLGGGMVGIGETTFGGLGMMARRQFSVLRTWGDPWLVGPDQTYVGLDVRFAVGYVGLGFGGYVRIPEADADPGVLFTTSFGIGN